MAEVVISGSFLVAVAISILMCIGILLTKKYHIKLTENRRDTSAVQAAHSAPTPRLGGVAIFVAIIPLSIIGLLESAPQLWRLLATLAPVIIAGLGEDLGFNVSPRKRLIAAAISSLLAVFLMGIWIPRADVPGLNFLISFAPFGIFLTVIAGAGVCNAFNLVDGINGLSSAIAITVTISLSWIASRTGQADIVAFNITIVGALLGFLLFNFPRGKIFMGDAGAYGVGHLLAWLGIIMLNRVSEFTPWALLLIFFWPIADTALAIFRRRRAGKPADQPDRLHFHQLVMRSLEIGILGRNARHVANPLSTLILMPMFLVPSATGVLYWDKPLAAGLALVFFTLLFTGTYFLGVKFAQTLRNNSGKKRLKKNSSSQISLSHKY